MILVDVILREGLLWVIGFMVFVAAMFVWSNYINLKRDKELISKKNHEFELKIQDLINQNGNNVLSFKAQIAERELKMNELAQAAFEKFKENELQQHREVMRQAAIQTAESLLQEWKIGSEQGMRKDAIARSMSVNLGKIAENLIPFSHHFKKFNPKDARFIGSPIDLIVFDGASDNKSIITIYIVEVKTGTSALTAKQKKIRGAVENKRIEWYPIEIGELNWATTEDTSV